MSPLYISILILGFAGSLHCAGMCGPLVLAMPLRNVKTGKPSPISFLLVQGGRLISYAFLGAIVGSLGKAISFGSGQQLFSLILGGLILLFLILPKRFKAKLERRLAASILYEKVRQVFAGRLRGRSKSSLLLLGIMNGLLPCGLVYAALAIAAGGGPLGGALLMLSFGTANIPALAAILFSTSLIRIDWKKHRRLLVNSAVACSACLLILRGMNLGIPYLSPEISKKGDLAGCCANDEYSELINPKTDSEKIEKAAIVGGGMK